MHSGHQVKSHSLSGEYSFFRQPLSVAYVQLNALLTLPLLRRKHTSLQKPMMHCRLSPPLTYQDAKHCLKSGLSAPLKTNKQEAQTQSNLLSPSRQIHRRSSSFQIPVAFAWDKNPKATAKTTQTH